MELFLSHATADADLVGLITSRLEPLGVVVYAAEHDNQAGTNVHAKVADALRRCDLMVVLLTAAGYNSHYVHQEIGFAQRANKLTIPMVTSVAARRGLGMLEGIEYIQVDEDEPSEALQKLSHRVAHIKHSRQQRHDDLVVAALALVAIGIIIMALGD